MGKTVLLSSASRSDPGSPARKKVSSACDLGDAKVNPYKEKIIKDDNIHVYEISFCNDWSVYADLFTGPMVALHLSHRYPNVWFIFLSALTKYCEHKRVTDEDHPATWQALCASLHIKIVSTSPSRGQTHVSDEDEIGTFVKNRVAIYCDKANMKNICWCLDGFVAWRLCTSISPNDPRFEDETEI